MTTKRSQYAPQSPSQPPERDREAMRQYVEKGTVSDEYVRRTLGEVGKPVGPTAPYGGQDRNSKDNE